ncbi:LacI family transcriptional regulator [Demequina sp. B12]|uniref:LacI family DNA-binding transcriptional regulator n=1 Tax=Demequina sp. B12 TaxID=2992757 RepID=UPI00237A39E5|nr:LacI family DNA-binding transcriptional regulator [Demequina sp. B12]MDE0572687.1 LacI family transcriptional regulator [Demequina sp. B12]
MGVSVKQVAQLAGVSVGTVSNVLNRPDTVRPETIHRVHDAIEALGYVRNDAARQLRAGQSNQIALIVLDMGNPFFTDVARGAEDRAAHYGRTLLLANSDESATREAAHLDQFERQRVSGVLLVPTADAAEHVARLRARGVPVVLVDRGSGDHTIASVAVDDVSGGRLAAMHVLAQGRERIAFVGGPSSLHQVRDRCAGARAAVREAGADDLIVVDTPGLTLDAGREAGERLRAMVRAGTCDAILAANDLIAIGLQQALLAGPDGVRIPEDVALVGYDDIAFAAAAVVPITSVRQPRDAIGSTAVDLLVAEGEKSTNDARQHVVYQPELVVRASSQPG